MADLLVSVSETDKTKLIAARELIDKHLSVTYNDHDPKESDTHTASTLATIKGLKSLGFESIAEFSTYNDATNKVLIEEKTVDPSLTIDAEWKF